MSSSKIILALCLGASAWAQTLPAKPQVKSPVAAKPNAVRTSPSTSSSRISAPALKPTATAAVPSVRARSGRRKSPSVPFTRATSEDGSHTAMKAHRDPFVSPVVERTLGSAASCAGSKKRCLAVGEIVLQGVVRSPSGFIAVVMNGEHTFFLREDDPLADGEVVRITRDTIVLRERSSDALGRPFMHEVTKKLGVPAV
jgi:hypothetical protein